MRTTEQILAQIDAEQAKFPELAGLKTSSVTGVLTYLKRLWATLVQQLEGWADQIVQDIEATADRFQVGTLAWYVEQAKRYQWGHPVVVMGGRVTYAEVVPSARLIAQAAATETATGRLLLKVVKQPVAAGPMSPLTAEELTAFRAYMAQVKWAGVGLDVVSLPADELRIEVRVKVDPLVLSGSGALLTDAAQRPAQAAVERYLQRLPYDSRFTWTGLTDALQTLPGVVDFTITKTWGRAIVPGAATPPWTEFVAEYAAASGHMRLIAAESLFTYSL